MKDFEGDWSSEYDSAQIGNIVEKDKVVYCWIYKFIIKGCNNIIILGYSEINQKKKMY